jgi:DNA-binding CsgD family transcriptional regulator
MKKSVYVLFYLIILSFKGYSNENTTQIGNAFIINYESKTYQSGRQIWDMCKGKNGMMYFANGPLMEMGTNFWNNYETEGDNPLRSVCAMNDQRLLVGGPGFIGYFQPGNIPGEMSYHSLMPLLDSAYYNFGTIWQIKKFRDFFLLRAGQALFQFQNDSITPVLFGENLTFLDVLGNDIYIQIAKKGLGIIVENEFQLLPYGDVLSSTTIIGIAPYNDNSLLIFTDSEGVFIFDGSEIKPYEILNNKTIINSQISTFKVLENGIFSIGTVKEGVFLMDQNGNILQNFSKKNGLQNNTIISMMADPNDNLWVGLDNGISFIELNSCLSVLNNLTDVGTGYVSKYFDGKLYLGTNQGLFYTEWDRDNPLNNNELNIQPVENTTGQVWSLFEHDGKLFCGHHKGLLQINNDRSKPIGDYEGVWQMDYLIDQPGFYIISTYRGFFLLQLNNQGNLLKSTKLTDIPSRPRTFLQDEHKNFWIVTPEQKLYRFTIDTQKGIIVNLENYTQSDNLPDYNNIKVVGNQGKVFFSTDQGLYNFDNQSRTFIANTHYNQLVDESQLFMEFFQDDYNRIWYTHDQEIGYFPLQFGKMEKTFRPFNRILDTYTFLFGSINVIDEQNVLFGVENGFYLYRSNCVEQSKIDYHAYIADVWTHQQPSSWHSSSWRKDHGSLPVFRHNKNAFEFFLTSNFFETDKQVFYSFYLEGFENSWGEWQSRNTKEYNNLREGTYTFHLRAKNAGGIETDVSSFTFIISPPFYRSTAAWITYVIIFVVFIILFRRYLNKKMEAEKNKIAEKKQLELEQKKKVYEEKRLIDKQRITELENEKLHQELVHKSKELSNSLINLVHMNDNLRKIKTDVQSIAAEKDTEKRDQVSRKLIRFINSEMNTSKYMELFDLNFSAVHEDFIEKLQSKYPNLTQNEIKLCAFIKMNKSTKEIASLMNISSRGVETSRYRLRNKLGLAREDSLYNFISSI